MSSRMKGDGFFRRQRSAACFIPPCRDRVAILAPLPPVRIQLLASALLSPSWRETARTVKFDRMSKLNVYLLHKCSYMRFMIGDSDSLALLNVASTVNRQRVIISFVTCSLSPFLTNYRATWVLRSLFIFATSWRQISEGTRSHPFPLHVYLSLSIDLPLVQ